MSFSMICIQLLKGLGSTCLIFALTLLLSLPLGLLVCFGRMSRFKPLQYVVRFFISILRGTPLMLQLIVVCFAPYYVFGMKLTAGWTFAALIIGFVINYAAYFAEIYRGGIESIPVGQYEAAEVLGYTRGQTFGRIILPQMVKHVLPPVTNEVITLVKDTSLARVILVYEIIWEGQSFIRSDGLIWPLFFTGLFYLAFTGLLTLLFGYLERKLDYFRV